MATVNIVKRLNYNPIGGAFTAAGISFDNTDTSLIASNVQDAIEELDELIIEEYTRASTAEATLQVHIDDANDRIDQEIQDREAADALLVPLSSKGQPNGVASLDANGKVPALQLPSYVDDVLEFPTLAAFPEPGETGKIYVALNTNKCYRWSGTVYIEISPSEVTSVFGRIGAVVSANGDYNAGQITNTPSGNLSAFNVQGALNELQTDVDGRALQSALTAEESARIAADSALQTAVNLKASQVDLLAEISRATSAEAILQDKITDLDLEVDGKASQAALTAEISRATAAETTIQTNLTNHINSGTAHNASGIVNVPSGTIYSTTVQGALNELQTRAKSSPNDIAETAVNLLNNQTTPIPVAGFVFSSAVRGFNAFATIEIDAANSIYESLTIIGTRRASGFVISVKSTGDYTGVNIDITSAGQITYTSPNSVGFVESSITFRAITTDIA